MRWTRADQERVNAVNRSYLLSEERLKSGRDWRSFMAVRRVREQAEQTRDAWRAFWSSLPTLAYTKRDAEARWLLDRATPGAFAAARAANRLRVLNAVRECPGCSGQGFCQCDPLPVASLRGYARPEFD